MHNLNQNIGFQEKRQFVHEKLAKIVEISYHNIDPNTHKLRW
jgi:hypothetical protein